MLTGVQSFFTTGNTTNFIDMRSLNQYSHWHVAIRFRQSCIPYNGVVGMPALFSKLMQAPLCGLFVQHGCLLFYKFTSFFFLSFFSCPGGLVNPGGISVHVSRFLKFSLQLSSPLTQILLQCSR